MTAIHNEPIPYKIYLEENEMPKAWYNLRADMKNKPAPLLNPGTHAAHDRQRAGRRSSARSWCSRSWTTPPPISPSRRRSAITTGCIVRAPLMPRLPPGKEALGTPAKIYYKFEGNNTSGSHKLNSAIAQAYYAKKQGLKGVTTETGAGQWGTALSMACSYFGLDCKVYMVKVSYEQKPFRREVMRTYGASVTPSPSMTTEVGRKILAEHPGHHRQPGLRHLRGGGSGDLHARATAMCWAACSTRCCCTSRVIGLETKAALDKYGVKPDIIIGCAGGGSNLGGLIAPVHGRKAPGRGRLPHHRGRARLLPQLHPRQVRLRLLRHRHGLPAGQDVHSGQRLHPQRPTTRAACATTA